MARLATACAMAAAASGAILSENSFKPPFTQFDAEGMRRIENWRYGGVAEVKEHFVRLTSDRQSKRGWAWNTHALTADAWTATVKFRVSGQGKKLFGDGLAMWFTSHAMYREGPVHAFTDKFAGFGVIFDTYVNTDPGHVHKDILFITNDGTKSVVAEHGGTTEANPIGCDADFRFWEGRQDFNPTANHSAVRVTFRDNQVSVQIDPRGSGEWKTCFDNAPVAAAADWWKASAYMGFTASTGDLADNHDLLRVLVSPDGDFPSEEDEGKQLPEAISTGDERMDQAVRSVAMREAAIVSERLLNLHHHLEHQLTSLNEGVKSTLKKIEAQEAENKKRIEELEIKFGKMVANEVDSSISGRIKALEEFMGRSLDARLNKEVLPSITAQLETSGRSWILPFAVFAVVIIGAVFFLFTKYRKLMKTHLP